MITLIVTLVAGTIALFMLVVYLGANKLRKELFEESMEGKPYRYRMYEKVCIPSEKAEGVYRLVKVTERYWYGGDNIHYEVTFCSDHTRYMTFTEKELTPYRWYRFWFNMNWLIK